MIEVEVLPNGDRLAKAAAKRVVGLASKAMAERGRCVLALAGGSTPQPVYRLLAEASLPPTVDWRHADLFWGDERCVPPDHADSNYRMARKALLDRVDIPAHRVHRILGELPPREAAAAYRAELATVLGDAGRFDLILLGLGSDGHTASLFPGTTALEERQEAVVAVYVEKLASWRVTLTLPTINDARNVIFLVSGARKVDALARVWAGEHLPAGMVQPEDGTVIWLADQDAAAGLPPDPTPSD